MDSWTTSYTKLQIEALNNAVDAIVDNGRPMDSRIFQIRVLKSLAYLMSRSLECELLSAEVSSFEQIDVQHKNHE